MVLDSNCEYLLTRISHKPNGLVRNPSQPQLVAAETSTRRIRALLRVNPERQRRKSLESKPVGRISHSVGEKCGLKRLRPVLVFSSGKRIVSREKFRCLS